MFSTRYTGGGRKRLQIVFNMGEIRSVVEKIRELGVARLKSNMYPDVIY
jgi:hypothetical protein